MYCCIFKSFYSRQIPFSIETSFDMQPTLMDISYIETDLQKASRVSDSINNKISKQARLLVENVFLSCLPNKELAILNFLLKGYKYGGSVMSLLSDCDVSIMIKARKHLLNEAHKLLGFVRFSDYDGMLVSKITPKNFILPFIRNHFINRYSGEDFLIYDKTHKAALVYQNGEDSIIDVDNIEFDEPSNNEHKYRKLWKHFYDTVAIKRRENPRCRMTFMPKRYWENMTEMMDVN